MWHGFGQSAKTWETTPDGREGFQTIFLRRNFSVYLVDQPRRGRASRSTKPATLPVAPDEQLWFGIFRLGAWPDFYQGVQFPRDRASLEQFFRQMVPNIGPIELEVNAAAVSALVDRTGPAILITHSHSGGMGWLPSSGCDVRSWDLGRLLFAQWKHAGDRRADPPRAQG